MKYKIGLIGPGKLLSHVVGKLGRSMPESSGKVTGVCITDQEVFEHGVPAYSQWRDLVKNISPDYVMVLTRDQELRADIRQNLPGHIDLAEELPGKLGTVNMITMAVLKKKVEKKKRFLTSMVEAFPFAAVIFNRFGVVSHWNSGCEDLTGVKAEDVVGSQDVGRAFYDHERPLIGQMLLKDYSSSQYRRFFPSPDLDIDLDQGSVVVKGFMGYRGKIQGYYQVTAQKIVLDGQVIGAIELIQDLNALTFLQEEAARKQAALHSIVNHLPFPMVQTTLQGSVIFINKTALDFLGEMSGADPQDLPLNIFKVYPELENEFSSFLRGLAKEKDDLYHQERQHSKIIYREGSSLDVTCLSPPGQSSELIWIIRNVSHKERESQLNTALAMVGTISHELSQPLTAIINSSQLLSRTKPEDVERARRHQKIINEQGERLFGIYRKLQNITQVRMQKYLDTQILDLDESAEEMRAVEDKKK
ncbi:PAS domain-containing protein [Desulfonatronovibrio hydrogenovorans]|uniref:PAS domain-containing protein n=1 Tax=Desulfonatronovibrio hydrogenovorans TaxID=53245 RepID=UPI00048A774B|nr:PAS domain-containing protein [Desulfonatronovibrio hydrogenovorans]